MEAFYTIVMVVLPFICGTGALITGAATTANDVFMSWLLIAASVIMALVTIGSIALGYDDKEEL